MTRECYLVGHHAGCFRPEQPLVNGLRLSEIGAFEKRGNTCAGRLHLKPLIEHSSGAVQLLNAHVIRTNQKVDLSTSPAQSIRIHAQIMEPERTLILRKLPQLMNRHLKKHDCIDS